MSALTCPACGIVLTSSEAERGNCPSCRKTLPTSVAREGASRLYGSSPAHSPGSRGTSNPDHIPQMARVGDWMVRIGGAGMLFVIAGCCGWAFLLSAFLPVVPDDAQRFTLGEAVISGFWLLFGLMFLTFLVGLGVKILAGDGSR